MPDTDKRLSFAEALERLKYRPAELIRDMKAGKLAHLSEDGDITFAEEDIASFDDKRQEGKSNLAKELETWRGKAQALLSEANRPELEPPAEDDDADKQAAAIAEAILQAALALGVSDVHLDPLGKGGRLLLRRNRRLQEVARCSADLADKLRKALKAKAELPDEITKPERKLFTIELDGLPRQLKATALPTSLGLHLHLAIQEATSDQSLTELGYQPAQAEAIRSLLDSRPGLYLCIGAADNQANRHRLALANLLAGEGRLVVSLEHRLHFRSELLVQLELSSQEDAPSFDSILRAALGMSPDVIFLDDIRSESEALAIHEIVGAGITVVAQLRAADNVQGLLRLLEYTVPKAALARDLLAVVSRRLLPAANADDTNWTGFDLWLNSPDLAEKLLALEPPGDDLRAAGAASPHALPAILQQAVEAGQVSPDTAAPLLVKPQPPAPSAES